MDGKPYSVKFGKYRWNEKWMRWVQLKDLIGDAWEGTHWSFVRSDGVRTVVPVQGMVFVFSPERQKGIDDRHAEQVKALAEAEKGKRKK